MDKNNAIAFILIALIVLLWMNHMQRQAPELEDVPAPVSDAPPPDRPAEPAPPPEPDETVPKAPLQLSLTGGPDAFHRAWWTNQGAAVERMELTQYRKTVSGEDNLPLLQRPEEPPMPPTLLLRDMAGRFPLDTHRYEVEERSEDGRDVLVYTASFAGGLRVEKKVSLPRDAYVSDVAISFRNESGEPIEQLQYEIVAGSRIVPRLDSAERDVSAFYAQESQGRVRYTHHRAESRRMRGGGESVSIMDPRARLVAAGVSNRYFAVVLMPQPDPGETPWARDVHLARVEDVDPVPDRDVSTANVVARIATRPLNLAPGESAVHRYEFFGGPKDPEILAQYPALDGVINYGWFLFQPISKLLDWVLRFSYRVTGNYGLAILLLTLIVKGVLHPLSRKSQISMHKMKQIQPFINELREKYKDDKERLAREQMQLMREHGANPLTGCLPVFLQLPIFIGLFQMIRNAITLRHQGFLWIQDLSSPDTVGHIAGFPVNIMPVLMVGTWVLQQATMPKPDDPQQRSTQKMMMFMPIVFGFMLYNHASGLALYWFTSTLVAIAEQKWIKWQIEKHHSAPVVVSGGSAPAPAGKQPSEFSPDRRPKRKSKGGAKKR